MKQAVIWSTERCPYCIKARALLESQQFAIEERKIGPGSYTKQQLLEAVPGAKSVPQIFIDGTHIGGYDSLTKYLGVEQ